MERSSQSAQVGNVFGPKRPFRTTTVLQHGFPEARRSTHISPTGWRM